MGVLVKARRRREIFEDLALKIVDFMKKIDETRPLKPQNFLGAFGADYLSSAYPDLDFTTPPLVSICREQDKGPFTSDVIMMTPVLNPTHPPPAGASSSEPRSWSPILRHHARPPTPKSGIGAFGARPDPHPTVFDDAELLYRVWKAIQRHHAPPPPTHPR